MAVSDRISVEHPRQGYHSLSALLGLKVRLSSREVLGKVVDLMVDLDLPLPEVVSLVYRHPWGKERWCVAWAQVASVLPHEIVLKPDTESTQCPARSCAM